MPGLGERFRAAREARGLSLSDVSEQIRIRSVYLAAIEEENWSAIGAPVYVRGFLRTYARFLGLDTEEVVATFNSGPSVSSQPVPAAPERISRSAGFAHERSQEQGSRGAPLIWAAAVVAVLLVAFVVYNEFTMHRTSAPASTAEVTATPALPSNSPSEAPAPSATPAAGPGLDGPKSIALVLSAPSWLRVTVDGNVSMEGTFPAGTSKTFHGKNALVRIGNAGGVEIFVDGKDVGKLGKSGDVAEHAFTL